MQDVSYDSSENASPGKISPPHSASLRKRLLVAFALVVALAALGALIWWFVIGERYVSTDNAYVGADVAQITPQVGGMIAEVPVTDTTTVTRNQVLARIDPADARLAYEQAQANYGLALRHVSQYFANVQQASATVAARQADLQKATLDYQRRLMLIHAQAISSEQLSDAKTAFDSARANLAAAQQVLAANEALVRGANVSHNPEVLAAKAALDTAKLNLERTVIRAPFDGVVAQMSVQVGQRVSVGQVLMTLVPTARVYVDANFKENQLTDVHIGQSATLTSDLYGSNVIFHGRVVGVGGGTGSAFSVIPAQNATGNWIKVVQRLPVRINLDPRELARHPLRVGLSMNATIDLRK